jgi:hypothetical protein
LASGKADGAAALSGGVIKPAVATHGKTMIGCQPLVMPGWDQHLPAPPQEFFEIDFIGAEFLFVCERDVFWHLGSSPI